MKISVNSILIGVSDIRKAVPFYEKVFGVTFNEIRPPYSTFTLNGIEFEVEENSPERSEGWAEKYLGTPRPVALKVENVEEFLQIVEANGGKTINQPRDMSWGWRNAEFADLDGNTFIIEQKLN